MNILTCLHHRDNAKAMQHYWNRPDDQWISLDSMEHVERYSHADALICDLKNEDFPAFCELIEKVRRISDLPIIVLIPAWFQWTSEWDRFCKAQLVYTIHDVEHITDETITEIEAVLFASETLVKRERSGKMIMFIGTTPNIGTTVVAFGSALQLAKRAQKSIAYICLNLKSTKMSQYIGVEHPSVTLDQIRTDLKTRSLYPERLKQLLRPVKNVPNLHVLYGNEHREQAEYYSPDDIRHLLHTASEAYDVCLIDVNAYWDNAATITAALQSDMKFIVTRNHRSYFQTDLNKWLLSACQMVQVSPQSFDMFVTQHDEGGYRLKDIRKETGLNVIGKMKRYDQIGSFIDRGDLIGFFESELQAVRELDVITRLIQSTYGWSDQKPLTSKKGLLKRMWSAAHS